MSIRFFLDSSKYFLCLLVSLLTAIATFQVSTMLPPTILVSPKYFSFVASLCFVTALELQLSDVKELRGGLLFKGIFVASYQKHFSGLISKVLLRPRVDDEEKYTT